MIPLNIDLITIAPLEFPIWENWETLIKSSHREWAA